MLLLFSSIVRPSPAIDLFCLDLRSVVLCTCGSGSGAVGWFQDGWTGGLVNDLTYTEPIRRALHPDSLFHPFIHLHK